MPPTKSTFRGPWPSVRTRSGRPCTEVPATCQGSTPVGPGVGVGVGAVVGLGLGEGPADDSTVSALGTDGTGPATARGTRLSTVDPATRPAVRPTIAMR